TEVGIRRVNWPRTEVLRTAGWGLCRIILNHWLDKEGRSIDRHLFDFVTAQWEERKLDRTSLRSHLETRLIATFGRPPEDRIAIILEALTGPPNAKLSPSVPLPQVFRQILDFVGTPGSEEREPHTELGNTLSNWMRDFSTQVEGKLVSMVLSIVEQPGL